jgi:hypothetical protein
MSNSVSSSSAGPVEQVLTNFIIDPEHQDTHNAVMGSLMELFGLSEKATKELVAELTETIEKIESLANANTTYNQLLDKETTGTELLDTMQSDPGFIAWAKAENGGVMDADALKAYINAPTTEGGLGIDFQGDPLTDTSWMEIAVENNEAQMDALGSLNQMQTIELQQLTNEKNILITMMSSIVKSYGDALLSVANKA